MCDPLSSLNKSSEEGGIFPGSRGSFSVGLDCMHKTWVEGSEFVCSWVKESLPCTEFATSKESTSLVKSE